MQKERKAGAPKSSSRPIGEELRKELDKVLIAKTVEHDPDEMVYHPLLAHLSSGGFYHDPSECAEVLRDHCVSATKRYKIYAFATTPEFCQSLDVDDLIESASQDMYEDWYERVNDECKEEIAIAQATLDALHKRLQAFPTFRVDYSRSILLPIPEPR